MIRPVKNPQSLAASLAAAVLALAGCVGTSGADTAATTEASKPDSTVPQVVREPLTSTDFAGLDSTQLVMQVPWTENRINRDPTPKAATASFRSATTKSTTGFDRAIFEFDETTPFPGYGVSRAQPGDTLACGQDTVTLDLDGSAVLLVRLNPARRGDGTTTWVREGTKSLGATRFQKAGIVCDDGHAVTWAAGLAEGTQLRVLEMKKPPRLVVDVR